MQGTVLNQEIRVTLGASGKAHRGLVLLVTRIVIKNKGDIADNSNRNNRNHDRDGNDNSNKNLIPAIIVFVLLIVIMLGINRDPES